MLIKTDKNLLNKNEFQKVNKYHFTGNRDGGMSLHIKQIRKTSTMTDSYKPKIAPTAETCVL